MTIQQLLSPTISNWICEVNKKHPHMTNEEFLNLFDEWFEKNEDSIVLNESVDMSKYSKKINEAFEDFDEEEPDFDGEAEPESEETEDEKEVSTSEDEDGDGEGFEDFDEEEPDFSGETEGGETFADVEGGDSEVKRKPVKITPLTADEAEEVVSKIKGRYKVNNGVDFNHNIFNVVNGAYDWMISEGKGENLLEHNIISLLETSNVEDMSALFAFTNLPNVDLSSWDTSAVLNMEGMFYKSTFNSKSIEDWDVSMCSNFKNMFSHCRFSGDISSWTPGTVDEIVYDEWGRPKQVHAKDPSGKPLYIEGTKDPKIITLTKKVPAELPKVGSKTHDVKKSKMQKIVQALKDLDDKLKEAEESGKTGVSENYKMNNIVDFETFINEGFVDKIKSGIKKIKNVINAVGAKINDYFVAVFNNGSLCEATSKFTSINYAASGKVPGVSAYSEKTELVADYVKSEAPIPSDEGYYDFIEPGSNEYQNFMTLCEYASKVNESNTADGEKVIEEERMPLSSQGSGVSGVGDIGSKGLEEYLKEMIFEAPAYMEDGEAPGTLLIFGAPGIGKTSIPKSIISSYNEAHPDKKKALIVVECGELTLDGFYLPIPEFKKIGDAIENNPDLIEACGLNSAEIEKYKGQTRKTVTESVKSWLPVYKRGATNEETRINNAIANGRSIEKMVKVKNSDGSYEMVPTIENTTEGGIILFDEFLRADPDIFKVLMQIFSTRSIGQGEKFGSKWSFICCSNRPVDDEEVSSAYDKLSIAAGTRWLKGIVNFIPDFFEWKKWAETKGGFDEYTLEFLSMSTDENKEEYEVKDDSGVSTVTTFKNWHNVDLDDRETLARPIPRTWSALMQEINKKIKRDGLSDILEVPTSFILNRGEKIIGKEMAEKYANFIAGIAKKGGLKVRELFNKKGYSLDTTSNDITYVVKRVEDYMSARYYRRGGEVSIPSDKEMWTMAYNLHGNYLKISGTSSFLSTLHSHIIDNIFKIRSTDTEIIKKLNSYLSFVKKHYNLKLSDGQDIPVE